jgi:hypothetical protein
MILYKIKQKFHEQMQEIIVSCFENSSCRAALNPLVGHVFDVSDLEHQRNEISNEK